MQRLFLLSPKNTVTQIDYIFYTIKLIITLYKLWIYFFFTYRLKCAPRTSNRVTLLLPDRFWLSPLQMCREILFYITFPTPKKNIFPSIEIGVMKKKSTNFVDIYFQKKCSLRWHFINETSWTFLKRFRKVYRG